MKKYTAKYKPNQLIYGEHEHIAIVTGWTPAKRVKELLDPSDYAVIGQFYNAKRGLNFLIRNLLLNPQITHLFIIDATREDKNAGACQCLLDFFKKGVKKGINEDSGKDAWVVNSDVTGYIDIEINKKNIRVITCRVNCHLISDIKTIKEEIKKLYIPPDQFKPLQRDLMSLKPIDCPYTEVESKVYPNTLYGHRIEAKTIAEAWVKLIHRIRTTGKIRPTGYDGQWQELINLMTIVTDEPEGFYFPDPNYLPCDRPFIESYLPQMLSDAPYEKGVKYTYGQRMRSWFGNDQIEKVINKLIGEVDAASAVVNLWDSGSSGGRESFSYEAIARFGRRLGDSDHDHGGSPCLNHIWFRIVDGALSVTATFRSNDMFSAWPSNAMGLRALQIHVLEEINKRGGFEFTLAPLITISQSAHIYDDCWDNADNLIKKEYVKICNQRDYYDPSGSFNVYKEDAHIVVEWLSPDGSSIIKTYRGNNPIKLRREIAIDCPSMSVENALYIGDMIGQLARD